MGIVGSDALRGVLKFESMAKHQVVALRAILAELFLELGRSLGLDMADRSAEAVPDTLQTLISATIPGLIADGSGSQQCNSEWCPCDVCMMCCRIARKIVFGT